MGAIILAALEAAAPTVLPALFKALGQILAAWLDKKIDTETALAQMHQAVADAGVDMRNFDGQISQQHADFVAALAALAAKPGA